MNQKLKELLRSKKITHKELARRIGYTESYVNQAINGHIRWNKRAIKLISIMVSIPLEELAEALQEPYERETSELIAERDALARGVA